MEDIYIVSKKMVKNYSNKQNEYILSDGDVCSFNDLVERFGIRRTTFAYRVRIYGLSDIRVLQPKKVEVVISTTKENPPKKIIGMSAYNDKNVFMSDEGLLYFITDIERYFGISQYQIRKFLKKNASIDKNDVNNITIENSTKKQKEMQRFNRSLFCIKNGVECNNYLTCLDEMIICRSKNKRFKPKSENCYINEKKEFITQLF